MGKGVGSGHSQRERDHYSRQMNVKDSLYEGKYTGVVAGGIPAFFQLEPYGHTTSAETETAEPMDSIKIEVGSLDNLASILFDVECPEHEKKMEEKRKAELDKIHAMLCPRYRRQTL